MYLHFSGDCDCHIALFVKSAIDALILQAFKRFWYEFL